MAKNAHGQARIFTTVRRAQLLWGLLFTLGITRGQFFCVRKILIFSKIKKSNI
jgi:hypothetical protein